MGGARYPWAIDALDSPNAGEFMNKIGVVQGTIRWVDSGTGSDSNDGLSTGAPFATIDAAISASSDGDVIYVFSGHAENITAADGIDCDVAGVQVIGLGTGNNIPTISFTAAAGSITVAAANVLLRNLRLVAAFDTGVTAGITVAAAGDGLTLDGIQFRDTLATTEFLAHIKVATTVTDLLVENCSFVTLAGSLTNSILFAGTSSNTVIRNNRFFVDSSDSVIDHLAGIPTNILIEGNFIVNQDTGAAGYVIDCHASGTGMAINNRGAYNKVDAEMTKGAAMWWCENYFSNTIAESGLLEPATSHAIP